MSSSAPLFDTIEADDPEYEQRTSSSGNFNATPAQVSHARIPSQMATNPSDAESGLAGILRQSAHPGVLLFLYGFRIVAIAVYILSGLFISNYVLSSVIVVVLLAMDFWNCRPGGDWLASAIGIKLTMMEKAIGYSKAVTHLDRQTQLTQASPSHLRSYIAFALSPLVPILSVQIAVYTFPLLWLALLIVSILKFNLSFVPIVVLALVFNVTNAIGFTYADRDAKQKWANNLASSGWSMGVGGIGGQILSGVVKNSVGRVFG